jgi:general secretion pathway protein G
MLICQPRYPRRCVRSSCNLGFTLIELMVVLLILALLSTIAAPRVARSLSKAKIQTARIQVDALSAAVDAFVLDVGRPPLQSEGLKALVTAPSQLESWDGPYIKKQQSLVDPWGQPYQYSQPGQHGEYDVFTMAADKQAGGSGDGSDIGNW